MLRNQQKLGGADGKKVARFNRNYEKRLRNQQKLPRGKKVQ